MDEVIAMNLARMHARWAALEASRGDDCWAIGWHAAAADRWRRAGRRYQRALDAAEGAS